MRTDPAAELLLRPATGADLPAVAEIHLRARAAAPMPDPVHPPAQVRARVAGWDLAVADVWVAERDGAVVGFADATRTWLDNLYVDPAAQRTGVGSALLQAVMAQRPDGLGLWVFTGNGPARTFYARHGFVAVEHTDGSGNEEGEPDIHLAWPGTGSAPHPADDPADAPG